MNEPTAMENKRRCMMSVERLIGPHTLLRYNR